MRKEVKLPDEFIIRKNNKGRPAIMPQRSTAWSIKKRATFLDYLAATCNVKLSAQAVSGHHTTAFRMRRRDPEFAEAWDRALDTGYAALETMLVERARRELEIPVGESGEMPDITKMPTELALRLLAHHRRGVSGGKRGAGRAPRRASEEETYKAIEKKLAVLRKRIDDGKA